MLTSLKNCIKKIVIRTEVRGAFGAPISSTGGFADGQVGTAGMNAPQRFRRYNNRLYVADTGNLRIRAITQDGTPFDSNGTAASLDRPSSIAKGTTNTHGFLVVGETNSRLRLLTGW
jgi:hypothetical protein